MVCDDPFCFFSHNCFFYAYSAIWYRLTGGMTDLGGKGCEKSLQFKQAGHHFRPHDVIMRIHARGNPF